MSLCINKAWEYQTLTLPNPAVGAMILDDFGNILALKAHQKSGGPHAEVLALQEAYYQLTQHQEILALQDSQAIHDFLMQYHDGIFEKCRIYVTLEPCSHFGKTPPCSLLLKALKPKEIIIGTLDPTQHSIQFLQDHHISITTGVLEHQCLDLLLPFHILKQQKHLTLFKIAQRLNGDYQSGTISDHQARIFTHQQRSVAQNLFISGKTLRVDDPLLDCRFATPPYHGQPNIHILTKHQIPNNDFHLFKHHKQIQIHQQIPPMPHGFNIIEGGWKLFEALKEQIHLLLIHLSPTLKGPIHHGGFPHHGRFLHQSSQGTDYLLWLQNS